ncbi:hypothetical protein [Azohydromonas aeria]|uniref:hypothetical protein n=1 Tax=Azohydromonas aeria TaxID=2590212 RepID=UPI0012F96CA4|nr:hypothetical protein [Azohydromonas aeria]
MQPHQFKRRFLALPLVTSLFAATPAYAFDSCKVLLCLAGPWRSIAECRPDVTEFLRCWSRGKCTLNCAMAGGSNLQWASAANCPPQYLVTQEWDGATYCSKTGVINVTTQGVTNWLRVWWTRDGREPVLEYSAQAKAFLGEHADTKFDEDFQRWLAAQPPKDPNYLDNGGH